MLTVGRRLKRRRDKRSAIKIATLNMYLAVFWLDMLPNSPYLLIPHFFGGALCAITANLLSEQRRKPTARASKPPVVQVAEAPA